MLLSFKIGKKENIRVESLKELNEKLLTINPSLCVKNVKIDGQEIYSLNGLSIKDFSERIKGILEKNRNYLVITLHDNDFWDLLEILGTHLSSLFCYYKDNYSFCFLEYPLEELKKYSLEYIQNCYRLKKLLSETPEEIQNILKYFEESIDVYLMKETEALAIDGNGEYLLVALFDNPYEKNGYQII